MGCCLKLILSLVFFRKKISGRWHQKQRNILIQLVIVFTDGSRDPVSGRAGFGVYVEQLGLEIGQRISNESPVLTAELMTILWALWWIEEVKPREVIICFDSDSRKFKGAHGKQEQNQKFKHNTNIETRNKDSTDKAARAEP